MEKCCLSFAMSSFVRTKKWLKALLPTFANAIQIGLLIVAITALYFNFQQLRQNDSHLRLSQRPWVGLSAFPTYTRFQLADGRTIPKIRFIWKNFGPTPALHVVGIPYMVTPNNVVSADFVCEHAHALANGTDPEAGPIAGKMGQPLFPGQDTSMSDPNDDAPFPDTWGKDPHVFSILGCAVYTDQFGQEMETRTCHIVLPVKNKEPMIKPCAGGSSAR